MGAHCYRRPGCFLTPAATDRLPRPAGGARATGTVGGLRIVLVVNSFASSVTARNTVVVHRRLSRDHDVELVETNRCGHATRFAHDAARRGADVVVGFGGDGTVNEVATGIAGSATALGVLPGGSTNVFARTIGLPNDPVAAAELLDTGIGYDAAVVETVEKRASWKRWFGHPLFITAAVTTWAYGYDRKHPHFRVKTSERTIEDGYFTVVMNTNPYTYLGNRALDLSHAATFDRGLVVITFRTMRARTILATLGGALRGGGIEPSDRVDEQIDVDHLVIEHETPFPYQLDGDYLGETERLEFQHVPAAVELAWPR